MTTTRGPGRNRRAHEVHSSRSLPMVRSSVLGTGWSETFTLGRGLRARREIPGSRAGDGWTGRGGAEVGRITESAGHVERSHGGQIGMWLLWFVAAYFYWLSNYSHDVVGAMEAGVIATFVYFVLRETVWAVMDRWR